MQYTPWLLSIILLYSTSLISMKNNSTALINTQPNKKQKLNNTINISNKNKEYEFINEEPLKESSIILIHYLGNIFCLNNEYDKNKKRICTNSSVIPNNSHQIILKTNKKTINNTLTLMLPTAPENIIFNIPSNQIHYGDTINFDNNKKELIIKNITTNSTLLTIPTQKSFISIGTKKKGTQSSKSIIIYNFNLPFVIVKNNAYQKPLYYKKNLPIEKSKLLFTSSCSIRENEAVTINSYASSTNDKINNTVLIIEIAKALQKIKIYPIDNKFPSKLFICFNPRAKYIALHDSAENIIATVYTNQNHQEI